MEDHSSFLLNVLGGLGVNGKTFLSMGCLPGKGIMEVFTGGSTVRHYIIMTCLQKPSLLCSRAILSSSGSSSRASFSPKAILTRLVLRPRLPQPLC